MNAAKLFDTIMDRHAIKNDAELSRQLEILPPSISRMRNGKLPVGAVTILRISETYDMPIKEIRALAAA
jgi:plasmid maintenance system antidote protein VapI